MDIVKGERSGPCVIEGTLSTVVDQNVTGTLVLPSNLVRKEYTGSYTVIPKAREDQTLPTAGLEMRRNLKVEEIPYYETTNESGGYTVIIG